MQIDSTILEGGSAPVVIIGDEIPYDSQSRVGPIFWFDPAMPNWFDPAMPQVGPTFTVIFVSSG